MTTTQAIERSITHDEIVTIDYSDEAEAELGVECDNSVRNGPVVEFWGRDQDGDAWRVHLRRRCPTCTSTDCPGTSGGPCWTADEER